MHTKRIIPCLDVNNGRVVKGTNFINLRDAGDPIEVGKMYDKAGADELVFLDITASSDARNIKAELVRRVAETIFIPFTVGGGIRTVEDFKMILREGADKVAVNSAAIMNPTLISEAAERIACCCTSYTTTSDSISNTSIFRSFTEWKNCRIVLTEVVT